MSPLAFQVLEVASSQVGVRETSVNRGPMVDDYIRSVGLNPEMGKYRWCVCFVYWCFQMACGDLGIPNPMIRTASRFTLWGNTSPALRFKTPSRGSIFVIQHDNRSHVGLVEDITLDKKQLITIEGNTNEKGSHNGDGVYRRTRNVDEIGGYIDFGRPLELTPPPSAAGK